MRNLRVFIKGITKNTYKSGVGDMCIGGLIRYESTGEILRTICRPRGKGSTRQAEYLAIIDMLKIISKLENIGSVEFLTGDKVIEKQMKNTKKLSNRTNKKLKREAQAMISKLNMDVKFKYILPSYNLAAAELAEKAYAKQIMIWQKKLMEKRL